MSVYLFEYAGSPGLDDSWLVTCDALRTIFTYCNAGELKNLADKYSNGVIMSSSGYGGAECSL